MEKLIDYLQTRHAEEQRTQTIALIIAFAFAGLSVFYLLNKSDILMHFLNIAFFAGIIAISGYVARGLIAILITKLLKEKDIVDLSNHAPSLGIALPVMASFAITSFAAIALPTEYMPVWLLFFAWLSIHCIHLWGEWLQASYNFKHLINPTEPYKQDLIWINKYIELSGMAEDSKLYLYKQITAEEESSSQLRAQLANGSCALSAKTNKALGLLVQDHH